MFLSVALGSGRKHSKRTRKQIKYTMWEDLHSQWISAAAILHIINIPDGVDYN